MAEKVAFHSKNIILIYLVAFVGMVIFFTIPVQLPYNLAQTGVSNSQVGLALAISSLSVAIISLQYQKMKARLSFERISSVVFLAMGLGYIILAASSSYVIVILGLLTSGVGIGLVVPNLNVWLVSAIPVTVRGRTIGGLTMSIFLGQFISPIFSQPIVGLMGMTRTFGILGAVALLMGIGFVGVPIIQRKLHSCS